MQQNCTKAKELSVSLASVTQSRHRTSVKGSSTCPSGVCRGARTEAMPREGNNDGEGAGLECADGSMRVELPASLFVSLPRSPAHFVGPANTYLTLTSDPRSAPLPGIVSTNLPRRNSVHKSRRRWQVLECSHDQGGTGDGGWYRSHDTGCLP